MTRIREIGWYAGGLFGAVLGVLAEWSWQGRWTTEVWAFLVLLILAVGFAFIGHYIAGFFEDTRPVPVEDDPLADEYLTMNLPALPEGATGWEVRL